MNLLHRLAVAALAAVALPAAALAQGGSGGGGTTTPVDATPCASIEYTGPTGSMQLKGAITLSYKVTSCSGADETVTVGIDSEFDSYRPDAGFCSSIASWTAITLTLRPGETKGFST